MNWLSAKGWRPFEEGNGVLLLKQVNEFSIEVVLFCVLMASGDDEKIY